MSASSALFLTSSIAFYSLCSYPTTLSHNPSSFILLSNFPPPTPHLCFNSACLPLLSSLVLFPPCFLLFSHNPPLYSTAVFPPLSFSVRPSSLSCLISLSSSLAGISPPLTLNQSLSIYSFCAASTSLCTLFLNLFWPISLGLKLTFPLCFLYTLFSPLFCCWVQAFFFGLLLYEGRQGHWCVDTLMTLGPFTLQTPCIIFLICSDEVDSIALQVETGSLQ